MFNVSASALKRVALAAAVTAVCSQGAFAATKVVNDGYLTYSIATAPALYLLSASVKPTGKTTQTGGGFLSPTTFDLPIASTSGNNVSFAGDGLTFSKGTKSDAYTDLSFDYASKTIYGNETGGAAHVALFKGSSVSAVNKSGASFDYVVSGLALASQGAGLIGGKLGISSSVLGFVPFGSLTIKAVPEPSTYALIGLGLAGAAVVARRRRAA